MFEKVVQILFKIGLLFQFCSNVFHKLWLNYTSLIGAMRNLIYLFVRLKKRFFHMTTFDVLLIQQ